MIVLYVTRTLSSMYFLNATATTDIYTLSLHDALPISRIGGLEHGVARGGQGQAQELAHARVVLDHHDHGATRPAHAPDRKSTRLNSSHANISYAVFCLKKKKNKKIYHPHSLAIKVVTP